MARENWCDDCYLRYGGLSGITITPMDNHCWKCGIQLNPKIEPLNKNDIFESSLTDDTKMVKLKRLQEAKVGFINDLKRDSHNPYQTFYKWFGEVIR